MDNDVAILKAKIEKYRWLATQFCGGVTADNIRTLAEEAEQELRARQSNKPS